jgi:hypothetical protein
VACLLAVLLATFVATPPAVAAEQTVYLLDGREHTGVVTSLSDEAVTLTAGGKDLVLPLKDVQEIVLSACPDAMAKLGQLVVLTQRGEVLAASALGIDGGTITVVTAMAGPLQVPLDRVDQFLLPDRRTAPRKLLAPTEKLAVSMGLPVTSDSLFIAQESQLVPVSGALRGLAKGKVTFHFDGEDRTIDVAKVAAIRLARLSQPPAPPKGWVVGTDGTQLAFDTAVLDGRTVRVTGSAVGDMELPVDRVARVTYRSDRVVFLGTLTPRNAEENGTFDTLFPYTIDTNTLRKPLVLDGKTYARGVGMHSRCRLTYSLDGQYRTFVARAGIDDEARPAGNAVLTIAGDEKELLPAVTLTGAGQSIPLRLDVSGVRTLVITVEYGQGLDVGDHVDLAEARLIK